ncbi:MAG: Transcriptional regulator SlyA [Alphaproteobacteria bacterium MarineAlpha5_Bin12]|nr:hypothetical protein [Pelagibacteraceae bacterium]PPR41337.1 MAG: Transcriptional regulator SlyA [Alphaproteobacteria bacterium MarineAlpha5_Bin12]
MEFLLLWHQNNIANLNNLYTNSLYTNYMNSNNLIDTKLGLLIWKVSNLWQNLLRSSLSEYALTLNEYIILETLYVNSNDLITQVDISKSSGVNISVISTTLDILQQKKLIYRKSSKDNRKKNIELTDQAKSLIKIIVPLIREVENDFFIKLGSEKEILTNSIKLILGKKIRIKADKKL